MISDEWKVGGWCCWVGGWGLENFAMALVNFLIKVSKLENEWNGLLFGGYCWMVVEGSRLFEVIDRRMVFTLMAVAGQEGWIVVGDSACWAVVGE